MPEAEDEHSHLDSTSASYREAAASIPRSVEAPWWLRGEAKHLQVPGRGGQMQRMTTRLDSASALHREAAASLLDQSELAWRLRCEVKYVQVPGCSGKRQKRSHTLSLLPPRVVVQPYACAINRSCLLLHPVLRTTPVRQRHSWLHQHYSVLLRRQSSCSTIRVIRQLLH